MADIKKKFIDILFDDDVDDRELAEESINNSREVKIDYNTSKGDSPIKAKDILYRKSGSSAFINLDDTAEQKDNDDDAQEEYELSTQISPIFGPIKENNRDTLNSKKVVSETKINKPVYSHLDIITSPIYGYDSGDSKITNTYEFKLDDIDDADEELHNLFDEDNYLDDSYNSLKNEENKDEEDITLFKLFGDNK